MKMNKLELIVCYDEFVNPIDSTAVEGAWISPVLKELGIDYKVSFVEEETLKNEDFFPENAVVYVHCFQASGNINVRYVRELMQKRPDLKFILQLDPKYSIADFGNSDDYYFAKQAHEAGFNAANQVVVSTTHMDFFKGLGYKNKPIENSFKNYVQQLMELRK